MNQQNKPDIAQEFTVACESALALADKLASMTHEFIKAVAELRRLQKQGGIDTKEIEQRVDSMLEELCEFWMRE
ncbi:hypothetical protein [Thermogutta sp.]|jgi:hypothetical protein|uniref:hypothetical protein n=1 Tax=Thermogutta sp. TaxID=1962930 RepID=UPI0032200921